MSDKRAGGDGAEMTYVKAREYMDEMSGLGSVLGLDNIRELMHRLGDVQNDLKIVHAAGTNGKGSVCAFLSSVLIKAGYKVGRFSSPAVFGPLETIKIGNKNITQKAYVACLSKVRREAEKMEHHPTVFEMETALAFLYFYEEGCDVCVVECGLGGRDDATNVITGPALCVITQISMDHSQVLGRELSQIAEKKAGILKKGAPLVTLSQDEEVMEVIDSEALRLGCPVTVMDPDRDIVTHSQTEYGSCFDVFVRKNEETAEYRNLRISLAGAHQRENAALALIGALQLSALGFDRIDDDSLRSGLKAAMNPGRFEVIKKFPCWVIDGAHNVDAALRLKEALTDFFPGKRFFFIIGVFADKDYEGILRIMAPMAEHIITVHTPGNSRALPSCALAEAALSYNPRVSAAASIEEAVEIVSLMAQKKDVVAAFGSLSFLQLIKKAVKKGCV